MLLARTDKKTGRTHVFMTGTLVKDAQYTSAYGGRTSFSVKYDNWREDGDWKAEYMSCTAWRDLASLASQFERNDSVMVCGVLSTREYNDKKTGEPKTWTEVICDFIQPQPNFIAQKTEESEYDGFTEYTEEDDDTPFEDDDYGYTL